MQKNILLLLFCAFFITSYGQAPIEYKTSKYVVNPQITQQIKKFSFVDTGTQGTLKSSMRITVTWDGSNIFNQSDLDCQTNSFLSNDTIYITGYMGSQLGWGFQLVLFGDSCIIGSFALSDRNIYKYHDADSALLSYIPLASTTQKLTLSAKPTFSVGERITGFVQLKSEDFYYVIDQTKSKSNITLTAYFKTAILKQPE